MGRPTRGSRQATFYTVNDNPSLATLDSAFQLQEYIALLVRLDPHDVQRIVELPGSVRKDADPESPQLNDEERPIVDEACWIYEQLRRLAQDLTHPLITTLQEECTRQTCPEMKAGEWLYLCVAHGNSGGMEHCCAIDYIVHTLDSATALLNSPRAFPSRISIPSTSHRHFPSLARRLGRIFAHAYHHHRAAFESAEAEGALYARFLALARRFDLVPAEFLVIPPKEEQVTRGEVAVPPTKRVTLLTRDSPGSSPRLGGRARTDTMYLPGGFVSGGAADSPRRMPSPMAGTLFTESERVKNEDADVQGDAASVQPSVPSDPVPAPSDPPPPTVPPSSSAAPTVPSTTPDKPRVLARDFAIPGSHQFPARIDMFSAEEGSEQEKEREEAVAEEEEEAPERTRVQEATEEEQEKQVTEEREEDQVKHPREDELGEGEGHMRREEEVEEVEIEEKDEQDPAKKDGEHDVQHEDADIQIDVRQIGTEDEGASSTHSDADPEPEPEPESEPVETPAPTTAPINVSDVVENEEMSKEKGGEEETVETVEMAGGAKTDTLPESDEKE